MLFHSTLRVSLFAFLFLILVNSASAVGVAIQPERLRMAAAWGQAAQGEVLVSNPAMQPAQYHLAGPRDTVLISPANFRLDPGSSQLVRLEVLTRWRPRRLVVEVLARPLGATSLRLASGIRYPIELTPAVPGVSFLVRGLLLLSLGAGTWWAWRRRFLRLDTPYAS